MKEFIKEYTNPNEERMNFGLMNRDFDDSLTEYIIRSCKSLEVLQYVEFLGYEVITDEKDINLNDYIITRRKTKKSKDEPDEPKYMNLKDSRYNELILKFRLTCKDETTIYRKKLLVPIPDEDGYYTIKGHKYFMLYQLVDSSTYTGHQTITLKSIMPITLKRVKHTFADTDGTEYTAPKYNIFIFRKEMDTLLFYFAKTGVTKTLKYFKVNDVMRFVPKEGDKEKNLYFHISNKIFLEVNKHFFLKFKYVQSMVAMILSVVTNRLTFELLDDKVYWTERIGAFNSTSKAHTHYDKGKNTLIFFDRMLDETTKKILKLHMPNKKNIYSVVRWMIQNFNELKKKDNLDLRNKRIRCNEYIASLLTQEFSKRINHVIAFGDKKITLKKVKNIFAFHGDIIMQKLHKSGLLKFDDRINDMDFYSKFRYTIKGPNALGGKNDNNISIKYRGIHPSYIGRIDLNVCGSSDPGSTGVITPFCETDGLFFDGNYEVEDSIMDFEKETVDYQKRENPDKVIVDLISDAENINEVFEAQEKISENLKGFTYKEVLKNDDMYYIHINVDEEDEI